MSIAVLILVGLTAAALLWRAGVKPVWIAAALILAVAGYAIAGNPLQPAAPAPAKAEARQDNGQVEAARQALARDPANLALWGAFSATLSDAGRTAEAIEALNFAAATLPPSADLQVFLGTALLAHAEGVMTPAAQLAFARAESLAPQHPAPAYFTGLGYLQQGDPAGALAVWEPLMQRTPPGAPWRADLARKINAARTMQAAGVGR